MSKADKAFMMQNYYEAEKLYKADYWKEKNRAKKAELIFYKLNVQKYRNSNLSKESDGNVQACYKS